LAITIVSIQSDTVTDPSIIYWKTTTGYGKGYGASYLNNVYKIQYTSDYVFSKLALNYFFVLEKIINL
jgi:hypothetical protein